MNAIDTLIAEAKIKTGITSDNALAIEIGITRQTMSGARKGRTTFNAYARQRLADLTGRDIKEINALIELETETDETKRTYWRNFYERLGGMAASIAFVTLIVSAHPAEAAGTHAKSLNTMCIILNHIDIRKALVGYVFG